ncbi:hypothetical protein ACO2Q0_00225 [Phenylobacterium sp. VNQ135]|uniref:hypothetical protein n=1 Tax=Phenylobacterium sp. VNQ135 TaxID=3400922 RepID=UPI003C101BE2
MTRSRRPRRDRRLLARGPRGGSRRVGGPESPAHDFGEAGVTSGGGGIPTVERAGQAGERSGHIGFGLGDAGVEAIGAVGEFGGDAAEHIQTGVLGGDIGGEAGAGGGGGAGLRQQGGGLGGIGGLGAALGLGDLVAQAVEQPEQGVVRGGAVEALGQYTSLPERSSRSYGVRQISGLRCLY